MTAIFGKNCPWSSELNPVWEEQIAELFRKLGDTRDEDAIRTEV
jgi:hypothetical protein